jgi:hypothetical protein
VAQNIFGASLIAVILLRTANLFFLPHCSQICLKKNLLTDMRDAARPRHVPGFGHARLQIETIRKRESGLVLARFTIGDPEGNMHARASEHFYPFLNSSSRIESRRNRALTTRCA